MQKDKRYKHKACIDMHIVPISIIEDTEESYLLKVLYTDERGFLLSTKLDDITILKKDLSNWKEINA